MLRRIIDKIREIQSENGDTITMVAIEGGGGSGKSTLASQIVFELQGVQIVHMDDFYKLSEFRKIKDLSVAPAGYEYDIDRLISEVIKPLLSNKTAKYQINDWGSTCLTDSREVSPTGILLIEGCYSMINQLRDFYQLKIFVCCDQSVRLKRGLERDGDSALQFWINWMAGEDKYFKEQRPKEASDFIFNGEGVI